MTWLPPQPWRATGILWCGWPAFSAVITFRPFLWHVDYSKSPGPWFLAWRVSVNAPERACLLFAGIYPVYWSTVLNTLRYAIVPIAILFLFTAVRLHRFYEMSPKLVRGSILGAMMHSFAFAMCVMMIAEINAPRLEKHTEKGDGIFAVENCSAAYAPELVQFRCDLCAMANCTAAGVANEIAKGHYSYLILPDEPAYNPIAETLRSELSFDDVRFAVYRLAHAP